MKKLLLLLLTLTSALLSAQDMVVPLKGDTLRGKAKILGYDLYDRVQINENKKKTQLTALQIKAVFIGKDQYRTVKSNEGFRLMKLVSEGSLSLYLGRRYQSGNYDVEYLVKSDGSATEVPNIGFKKLITNFLDDCGRIKAKITEEDLGKKDLDVIISEYNACLREQTKTPLAREPLPSEDPKMKALADLRKKIDKSTMTGKKDALDILDDITGKVKSRAVIPNYLLDGLKSALKDSPELQADLENVLTLLK